MNMNVEAQALMLDWLTNFFESHTTERYLPTGDTGNRTVNVVDGFFAIAQALNENASAIHRLGNGSASTDIGAIENLAKELRDGLQALATNVGYLGQMSDVSDSLDSVSSSLDDIATALTKNPFAPEHALRQASITAEHYMIYGTTSIDEKFGKGFAKNNPLLLAAFMQVCAQDF